MHFSKCEVGRSVVNIHTRTYTGHILLFTKYARGVKIQQIDINFIWNTNDSKNKTSHVCVTTNYFSQRGWSMF